MDAIPFRRRARWTPTPTPGAFDHVTLTVSEPGGQTATQAGTSEYDVFDGPLTAQGATITAVEGRPTSGAVVASFSYNGPASLAFETSNFSGTVASATT